MTTRPRRSSSNAPEVRQTLDAFRHIVQALRGGASGRRTSVTGARLFALQQIAEHPNASINEIAARTFTHQSSVSVVIQRLVDAGLVVKLPAEDRRQTRLAVTGRGKRALARAPAPAQGDLVAAVSSLPAADQRTLARLMTTLADAVTRGGKSKHPPMFFEERER
jgi:DNA-binding MarR family transcriptional regulator